MTGYLPTQSFTYNHSRELMMWNIAVKEWGKLVERREQENYLYEEAQRRDDMIAAEYHYSMMRDIDRRIEEHQHILFDPDQKIREGWARAESYEGENVKSLINFGYLYQRPKDIYSTPQPSLDLLQEYHNKHYAPREVAHKKTLADRFVLAYAHMMVWFGSWLIQVGG